MDSGTTSAPQECVVDVGFALDGSGSVTKANWDLMLFFVINFARHVKFGQTGTRIGVVSYGNAAKLDITLRQYDDVAAFESAVQNISYKDENTNTAAGLRMLRGQVFNVSNGDRPGVMNVAIVITDGESTWDHNLTVPEASQLKQDGTRVFAIGITDLINMDELHAMASDPSDYYVSIVDEFTDLDKIFLTIVDLTCGIHPDTPTTEEPTTTTTTPTTTAPPPGPRTPNKIDLALLVDSSGSLGENWQRIKGFVRDFARRLTIGPSAAQVAVIQYSTQSFIRVPLAEYDNTFDLQSAIDGLGFINQRTNASGAIRTATSEIYNGNSRDRLDARDVILIVTDATSNTETEFLERDARAARERGIRIFAVGIGNRTKMQELRTMASKPYYYYMHMISDFDKLYQGFTKILLNVAEADYPTQEYLPVSFDDCPTDLVLLVDVPPRLAQSALDLTDDMWRMLPPEDQEFLVVAVTVRTGLQSGRATVIGENLADALRFSRMVIFSPAGRPGTEGDRAGVQNVVAIITTGDSDDDDTSDVREQMLALKDDGVKVFVIALGDSVTLQVMRDLTSEPQDNSFATVEDFQDLQLRGDLGILSRFRREICTISSRSVWRCGFELDEPGRCNLQDDRDAEFQWTVASRPTPSRHTGPDSAHGGQYFAFIEASDPRRNGDQAILYLPFSATGTFCLSFWYHMKGWHIGVFDVFTLRDARETLLWRATGPQGDDWLYGLALLQLRDGDQVGLRGIRARAFSGDIGIDDLSISRGPCPGDV